MTDVMEASLTQLGRRVALPESPDAAVLETVPNGDRGTLYLVRFTCPEFTSLCPMTSQPDFAHLVIDYVRSEEHTSELQSLMRISYAVFCLKKKRTITSRSVTCTQHIFNNFYRSTQNMIIPSTNIQTTTH